MENQIIQKLLDKKATQDNMIDLDAYAAGLTDMYNSLNSKNDSNDTLNDKHVLGKYEFRCGDCKKIHKMPGYAIAQITMRRAIIHTCECGHKNELNSFND